MDGVPHQLIVLRRQLEAVGFSGKPSRKPEWPGGELFLVRDTRSDLAVRVEQDQGLWVVELGVADDWKRPIALRQALDGQPARSTLEGFDAMLMTIASVVRDLQTDPTRWPATNRPV